MDLDLRYPAVSDLRARARRRIPHFAFEYLDSGTGAELQVARNRAALDAIWFRPEILAGRVDPDFTTSFLGRDYARPFGIAPIGMSGAIWPGTEAVLARFAARARLPYCLSSVATRLPEEIGPLAREHGWFQLYTPADPGIRRDILKRARNAGFTKLVLTVDVPEDSRRERQRRANVALPLRITPGMIWQMLIHPRWSLGTARTGRPRLKLAEGYVDSRPSSDPTQRASYLIRGFPDWDVFRALRDEWAGDLLVKGVTKPDDAERLVDEGADAIWVSNHGGRQFEPAPAAIAVLPAIRAALGPGVPIVYDSGVTTGVDLLRALALGADFVMLGRAWHYAVAALGQKGPDHLSHILTEDMRVNMAQMGAHAISDLADRLCRGPHC